MTDPVEVKHVPDRVVLGRYGYELASGYTEVGGMRFYPDRLAVGPFGQPVIVPARSMLSAAQVKP